MIVKTIEGIADDITKEDGGAAIIVTLADDQEFGIFVRIQSWDENAWNGAIPLEDVHEDIKKILNKKVRVTIEVLE
jgi:hypothetical protein